MTVAWSVRPEIHSFWKNRNRYEVAESSKNYTKRLNHHLDLMISYYLIISSNIHTAFDISQTFYRFLDPENLGKHLFAVVLTETEAKV